MLLAQTCACQIQLGDLHFDFDTVFCWLNWLEALRTLVPVFLFI